MNSQDPSPLHQLLICPQPSVYGFSDCGQISSPSAVLTRPIPADGSAEFCARRKGLGEGAQKTVPGEGGRGKGTAKPRVHVDNTKSMPTGLPFLPILSRTLPSTRPKRHCVSI